MHEEYTLKVKKASEEVFGNIGNFENTEIASIRKRYYAIDV
ncbi:unknown [Mycoplasma sp. CAG:611]|nr:unknown [Mycoplasma sp. CAG:611]